MEIDINQIAIVCHETNRAYCTTLGDNSQLPWADAADWQRQSAILGVQAMVENPALNPGDLHVSWMKQKEADGWVYGEVKDPEAKTHPCMVAYDLLPAEQRRKDLLFHAVVTAFMRELEPAVVPEKKEEAQA